MNQQALSSFIWSVADLLRGDYKQADYGKVILPFTVLRRLDCTLESTKEAVLAEHAAKVAQGVNPEPFPAAEVGPDLLQHVQARHRAADWRPGQHRPEPLRLHITTSLSPSAEVNDRGELGEVARRSVTPGSGEAAGEQDGDNRKSSSMIHIEPAQLFPPGPAD